MRPETHSLNSDMTSQLNNFPCNVISLLFLDSTDCWYARTLTMFVSHSKYRSRSEVMSASHDELAVLSACDKVQTPSNWDGSTKIPCFLHGSHIERSENVSPLDSRQLCASVSDVLPFVRPRLLQVVGALLIYLRTFHNHFSKNPPPHKVARFQHHGESQHRAVWPRGATHARKNRQTLRMWRG